MTNIPAITIETVPLELVRPSISFETVTFSDGQTMSFEDDEIIVFVGPNNAGKSAALRELKNWIARSLPQKVITNATLRKSGTSGDLKAYLEKNSQRTGTPENLTYSGIGYGIHHSHLGYFDNASDRHSGVFKGIFYKHVIITEAAHGPAFVEKVLEERDLESDSELEEARTFVTKVWTAAKQRTASGIVSSSIVTQPQTEGTLNAA